MSETANPKLPSEVLAEEGPSEAMVNQWRMTAQVTFAGLKTTLDGAFAQVANADRDSAAWSDDQWAHCGYDKLATTLLLENLAKLAAVYPGTAGLAGTHDFQADAQALTVQAPAE